MNKTISLDAAQGCMLGLAIGDTLGAPPEGGWLERGLWGLLGRTSDGTRCWTDDTQMTLDLAESLIAQHGLDQNDLAQRFARSYAWRRGYGPGAAKVLRRIRGGTHWSQANTAAHSQGSFGNGAAMRAAVLALWPFESRDALCAAARQQAEVTHAHPQGKDGAVLIAVTASELLRQSSPSQLFGALTECVEDDVFRPLLQQAEQWLGNAERPTPRQVARVLGNGITARASCVTAIYIALRHLRAPFDDMLKFSIACGGDVDTIAAMSGALWGIHRGGAALPPIRLEQHDRLQAVARELHGLAAAHSEQPGFEHGT